MYTYIVIMQGHYKCLSLPLRGLIHLLRIDLILQTYIALKNKIDSNNNDTLIFQESHEEKITV